MTRNKMAENASFCRKINNVCACCKYSRTMNSDFDGCICSEDMLEKFCAENEKAWVKEELR